MLALMGHMSRAMLERYSHIGMAAKCQAVESLRTVSAAQTVSTSGEIPNEVSTVYKNQQIQ